MARKSIRKFKWGNNMNGINVSKGHSVFYVEN